VAGGALHAGWAWLAAPARPRAGMRKGSGGVHPVRTVAAYLSVDASAKFRLCSAAPRLLALLLQVVPPTGMRADATVTCQRGSQSL
jgi:hypothetical protein